jgi:hypothetical protein
MSDPKEVEFYAAKANAWFNTRLEYDRSLLVLSAGGIGLLVTLLTTVGVDEVVLLLIFAFAIFSFIVCLLSVLYIFLRNAKHLEDLIAGRSGADSVLSVLDSVSIFSFVLGVLLSSIIGLTIATSELMAKELAMTDPNNKPQNGVPLIESYNGAANLAPGSTPILRTLQRSLIMGKRSVYVEEKNVQPRVQSRRSGATAPFQCQLFTSGSRAGY